MSISIEQLDFAYGRMQVLHGITAQARAGKITALVGPNAAGKSTLLRCIIGALRPRAGEITIDGAAVSSRTPRQLAARIAYVPQRSIVSASFTVHQVVELGRYALEVNHSKVESALQRLELIDIADRPYPQLSVGQQQRVTLARALAQLEPNGCLVLDEPTSAMDLRHVLSTMRLFREVASGGVTVIMAMHDLSLAASIADEAWLIDAGRLVTQGPVNEVLALDRLQHVFGVRFEWLATSDGKRRLTSNLAEIERSPTMRST